MTADLVLLGLVAVAAITAVVIEAVRATPPPNPARPDRLAHVEQATRSPAGAGAQTQTPHRPGTTRAAR